MVSAELKIVPVPKRRSLGVVFYATVEEAMQGNLTSDNPYHAKYLAVSTYDYQDWNVNKDALSSNYTTVYSNPYWTVYRLPNRLPK